MTNPVDSTGMPQGGTPSNNSANTPPLGPPLPPNDPWVKALATLFPTVPLGEIMEWASKFKDNMFKVLNNQIQSDLKRARASARKLKEAIEGD